MRQQLQQPSHLQRQQVQQPLHLQHQKICGLQTASPPLMTDPVPTMIEPPTDPTNQDVPTAKTVGNSFIKQYYQLLSKNPDQLHRCVHAAAHHRIAPYNTVPAPHSTVSLLLPATTRSAPCSTTVDLAEGVRGPS